LNTQIVGSTPAGRIADVDEITGMALYLASPASSFTTGQAMVVDGGLTISSGNLNT
jgi:NAD(P)-dependent dehydrogenase (short-subunit alcohol dehydrogenase family)